MKIWWGWSGACGLLGGWFLAVGFGVAAEVPQAEIVVANRYLQQTGASHAHLYLYRADGKLLRQLTKDDGGQDSNPVFAPDGESIVFTRELPKGVQQWWSIEPRGGNLRQLPAAPDWYAQTKTSPAFVYPETDEGNSDASTEDAGARQRSLRVDATADVKLTATPQVMEENPDAWKVRLQAAKTGQETPLGDLPGWSPCLLRSGEPGAVDKLCLHEGALQVAFLATSLGSTDGSTVHAICLNRPKMVRLARNWAAPLPLPGEAAFLTSAEERYVPFGDGEHTANCAYVDRWDSNLQRTRYARKDAAAVCYGASMYRPGLSPAVVTVHRDFEP